MKNYIIAIATCMVVAASSATAFGETTRTIVEDTGTSVEIPIEPKRIVTLHDLPLTVPLIELGVYPVGSHGRGETEETAFIRGSASLTGVDFDNSNIQWVGNYPADLERIAALSPDLILTTSWQPADVNKLRAIAPTVVFDFDKRSDWEIYDWLADLTNTTDKLDVMKRRYADQIELIKSIIDTNEISVSTIHAHSDDLFAYNPYGNIGKVLIDAGFKRPKAITDIPPGDSITFTAERIQDFDADFIITTYAPIFGDTPKSIKGYFESQLPGYCNVLHACREGQMYFLSRAEVSATSYYALGSVAYSILSIIGRHDHARFDPE